MFPMSKRMGSNVGGTKIRCRLKTFTWSCFSIIYTKINVSDESPFVVCSLALRLEIDSFCAPIINLGNIATSDRRIQNLAGGCLNEYLITQEFWKINKENERWPAVAQSSECRSGSCPDKLRSRPRSSRPACSQCSDRSLLDLIGIYQHILYFGRYPRFQYKGSNSLQVPPVLLEQPPGLTTSSTLNMYRPRTICGTPDRWARTFGVFL